MHGSCSIDRQTLLPVGSGMPTPQHVQWDPDLRYCLTTHAHSFAVWGTYPTFSLCCHLPGEICSALWSQGRLVYSTPVAGAFTYTR